ncbi:MAG: hypothetical protein ACOYM3_32600 [Terrimicrobiaceae bacterium]
MKKRTHFFSVLLVALGIGLAVQDASAPWAAHGIIEAGNPRTTYPVALALRENKTKVRVFIPVRNGEDQKDGLGYFVIQAKKRLPRSELEFRVSMERWKRYQEMLKKGRDYRVIDSDPARKVEWNLFYSDVERFENMARIEPETRDGVHGIFLELDIDAALRTYVVHDFLPWGGGGVRDGGLWLTYDVPSFVDALLAKGKSPSVGSKDGDQFRIQNVVFEKEKDGGRIFRVQIKKLSAGQPDLGKLGVKLRIWERSPSGSLVLANEESQPEWDTLSLEWKNSQTLDLLLNWKGPEPGGGNAYYGFSAEIIYDNRLQHSWSTSPELLTNLLAVEPLDSGKLRYQSRPERMFYAAMRKIRDIRASKSPENRQPDVEALRTIIQTLEMIGAKYPEWKHADVVANQLREAQKMLADFSTQESKGASPTQ